MANNRASWLLAAAFLLGTAAVAIAQTATDPPPAAGQSQPHVPKNAKVTISYEPPTNPVYQDVYNDLKGRHVLEELQHFLAFLELPKELSVKLTQCGVSNSWYDPHAEGVLLCYEIVDWIKRVAPSQVGNLTREDAIVGPFAQVALHELGHAMFDFFHVPIAGR